MSSPWVEMREGSPSSPELLGQLLRSLPGIDPVGAQARTSMLWSRSIKNESQRWALDTIVSMMDLTTLEGADTPERVRALVQKAQQPDSNDPSCPPCAAVCVYPDMIEAAAKARGTNTNLKLAAVSTAFPSGRSSLEIKIADTQLALAAGADEIDMVIDRGAFLSGNYTQVLSEIRAIKNECGNTHLKVILETSELATLDNIRRAAWLAIAGGADFVKTSTGKGSAGATPTGVLVLCQAVRDWAQISGEHIGVKAAGGVKTAKDAVRYLVLVNETLGKDWLTPDLFRFGASSLLNDVLAQRSHLATGIYPGPDYFSVG